MNKKKKALYITLFALDLALTVALFVISIIMIATMPKSEAQMNGATGMIGYFQNNPNVFLLAVVLPLILLLIANICVLVIYVKKVNEKKKVALADLSEEQKEALKKELLKDIDKK